MMPTMTNTALLENIRCGGAKRQAAIAAIYQDKALRNQVIAFVRKNNGNQEDGIDIFHEGIIAFDENVRKNKYEDKGKVQAYIFTVCRFMWLNKLKRNSRMVYTSEISTLDQKNMETPESLHMSQEQKELMEEILSQLGIKCKKILELWKLSYSMEEIAQEVGLGNAGIARRQRYNCYQKLIQYLERAPGLKSSLK
ncbi:MAG: sigma-70 family RNA polymerase sigma factor [Bacteroidota bacterium]